MYHSLPLFIPYCVVGFHLRRDQWKLCSFSPQKGYNCKTALYDFPVSHKRSHKHLSFLKNLGRSLSFSSVFYWKIKLKKTSPSLSLFCKSKHKQNTSLPHPFGFLKPSNEFAPCVLADSSLTHRESLIRSGILKAERFWKPSSGWLFSPPCRKGACQNNLGKEKLFFWRKTQRSIQVNEAQRHICILLLDNCRIWTWLLISFFFEECCMNWMIKENLCSLCCFLPVIRVKITFYNNKV